MRTESQRASIATELANRRAGDNQHAQHGGPANLPTLSVDQAKAAKIFNVSERSVRTAKTVKEADPELHAWLVTNTEEIGHQIKRQICRLIRLAKLKLRSLNCHRRHLTESQRAAIAAELTNMPRHKPSNKGDNCPPSLVSKKKASELLNVSSKSVQRAKTVKEADPELHSKEGSQIQLPSIKDAASAYKSRCANLRTYPSHSRKSCKAPKC